MLVCCLDHIAHLDGTLVFAKVLLCLGRSSREIQQDLWHEVRSWLSGPRALISNKPCDSDWSLLARAPRDGQGASIIDLSDKCVIIINVSHVVLNSTWVCVHWTPSKLSNVMKCLHLMTCHDVVNLIQRGGYVPILKRSNSNEFILIIVFH